MQHSAKAVDLDDLRLLIEPEASRKNIRLTWINEVQGSLPVAGESVRQAILNLLINACAATPPGGVVLMQAGVTDKALVIDVGDQGLGLPEDRAQYLVGRSDEGPAVAGGLGLWIVRRLVAERTWSDQSCRGKSA